MFFPTCINFQVNNTGGGRINIVVYRHAVILMLLSLCPESFGIFHHLELLKVFKVLKGVHSVQCVESLQCFKSVKYVQCVQHVQNVQCGQCDR